MRIDAVVTIGPGFSSSNARGSSSISSCSLIAVISPCNSLSSVQKYLPHHRFDVWFVLPVSQRF
eukprot:c29222_g1_i1 orf=162-353(+)